MITEVLSHCKGLKHLKFHSELNKKARHLMITIHCRLADLLDEKQVTREELAITSGISREKIDGYSKGEVDSILFHEIGIILSVLGCSSVSERLRKYLFRTIIQL